MAVVHRQLRETRSIQKAILDGIRDLAWVKDKESRFLAVNQPFGRACGVLPGDLAGKTDLDIWPRELAERYLEDDRQVIESGRVKRVEEPLYDPQGRQKWVETIKVPVTDGCGQAIGTVGIARDITDRKLAEDVLNRSREELEERVKERTAELERANADLRTEIAGRKLVEGALRESEDRYRDLVEHSQDLICTHDLEGRLLSVNPWAANVLGYSQEELLRRNLQDLVAPEVQCEVETYLDEIRKNGVARGLLLVQTREGEQLIWKYNNTLRTEGVTEPVVRGMAQDITESKRAEEEKRNLEHHLLQAQKMESLGVLAGGIAHDFNNLLMVVLGNAELAFDELPPMSPARLNLTEITTAARHAADLSLQMLAYAGRSVFAMERVGLGELVEEMATLLQTAISKKALLTLNPERGLPPISGDPSQIRQIVMNLIINASEAIGDREGVIRVLVGATRCEAEYLRQTDPCDDLPPGQYVYLEVTDTGIGMDAETRSRIFEPFFSTKFTGRGLGLSAVLGIVRAHKGALKVHSEPGKGTTFQVLFPALEDGGGIVRSNEPSPLAEWRGQWTVLLVDDEESLLALGARMLEHLGVTVLTAADGREALELYRERWREIDLVLMDLTMPHMDGSEALAELRRLNPDVRVAVASGYSQEDVASRFAGKGIDGVLQKPYTLAKMRELLAGIIPKRS